MRPLFLVLLVAVSGCQLTNSASETRWIPRAEPVVWDATRATAAELPRWTETRACPVRGELHYEARSALFGFVDDVRISLLAENDGTRLSIFSGSRVGKGDLGANAARVRLFFDRLQTRLAARGE